MGDTVNSIERRRVVDYLVKQLESLAENGIEIVNSLSSADLAYLEQIFVTIEAEEKKRADQQVAILANEDLLRVNLLQSRSRHIISGVPANS